MTRGSVSAVVVTLNEEERLRACLESLTWADELVVVDAESSDKTGQIADQAVHESVEVTGTVGRLGAPLVHRSYRGVADFLARADRYSTLAAEAWIRSGRPARLSDLVWRPLGRFLGMYVARAGFLDGWRGFLLASLYSYYVFIRSAKVWERARD